MQMISVKEFLSMGYIQWAECHWSIAHTEEGAKKWFKEKGFEVKKIFSVTYGKSLFAFWGVIDENS